MKYRASIEEVIGANGGFMLRSEMRRSEYLEALEAVKDGRIVRVAAGVFALKEAAERTTTDIPKVVPGGILCGLKAWSHYGLTEQKAAMVDVAIVRGRRIVLPQYPSIRLHQVQPEIFRLGETIDVVDGYEIPIYDIERCVCDAVKARNRIGADLCSEVVRNYLNCKECDLPKLHVYARALRVSASISKFLEDLQ